MSDNLNVNNRPATLVQRAEAAAASAAASAASAASDKIDVSGYLSIITGIVGNEASVSNPVISVNIATGEITATCSVTAGNIVANSTKTSTLLISSIVGSNLVSGNIRDGITVLGVPGSYSGASQSVTSYAYFVPSNGNSPRIFQVDVRQFSTFSSIIRESPSGSNFKIIDGDIYLIREMGYQLNPNYDTVRVTNTGNYEYITAYMGINSYYAAIKSNGHLVRFCDADGQFVTTDPEIPLTDVTQVVKAGNGYFVLANGVAYYTKLDFVDNSAENKEFLKATLSNKTIVKLLNQNIESEFDGCMIPAIDSNGNLGMLKWEESWEEFNTSITWETIAEGSAQDPFVNYYHPSSFDGEMTACILFALRSSTGLYYKINGDNNSFVQVQNSPSLIATNFLGYALNYFSEEDVYDETNDEYSYVFKTYEQTVALHIDTTGRLWKLSVNSYANSWEDYGVTGVNITQVGNDTDWEYVPPTLSRNQTDWAYKNGKLIRIHANDADSLAITWSDYHYNPFGRFVGKSADLLWFTTSNSTIDYTIPGKILLQ
jgi:hypothetical protein